ncbi:MAG: YggS family pyridoxal phosphate-dependent enzyme [Gemmatimonadetes bacterium]|nr:YggS family pyridoxal phosphate-dependent enzyme [Gemmatimonadota bacterium]
MSYQGLADRVAEVRKKIDDARRRGGHTQNVRIIAVTKTHGPEAVLAALGAGITDIGENKVQEALGKQDALAARIAMTGGIPVVASRGPAPAALTWHLIGHLQRNKVKHVDRFALFHAVDSQRLADAIHNFGVTLARPLDVLLEVNVSGEASKGGYPPSELAREADRLRAQAGLRVRGVMTMAPFDAPESVLREVFGGARRALETVRGAGHDATELSMGMSGDFAVAVEEGATMVRLGTVLFGERGQ